MKQEIKIKVDLEKERKELYDFIANKINEGYEFTYKRDRKWFTDNVAEKGINIVYFRDLEQETYIHSTLLIFITIEYKAELFISTLELTRINDKDKLPIYKTGAK